MQPLHCEAEQRHARDNKITNYAQRGNTEQHWRKHATAKRKQWNETPSRRKPSPSIFRATLCPAKQKIARIRYLIKAPELRKWSFPKLKLWKRRFRARLPLQVAVAKTEGFLRENEPLVQNFLPKHSKSASWSCENEKCESVSEGVGDSGWVSTCGRGCVLACVRRWVIEWVNESMSEWVSERASGWVTECALCACAHIG